MTDKKIPTITRTEIDNAKIASLSIRPNAPSAMGGNGFTPQQLRERFDALAMLAIERINAVLASLNGVEGATPFAKYIQTTLGKDGGGNYTLAEVLGWLSTTDFAEKIILSDEGTTYTLADFYREFGDKVSAIVKKHNDNDQSHPDIRTKIAEIKAKIDAFLDSNDINLDQLSEIIEFIKNNKSDPPLMCLYTIEPGVTIEPVIAHDGTNWKFTDALPIGTFNRPPKLGEKFFANGRTSVDHIPFHITAEITEEKNQSGNAVFKTLEAVPGSMPVFDITSIDTIYETAASLPSDPNGYDCYIAFYNGKPWLYSYVKYKDYVAWQKREALRDRHLYWVRTGTKAGFYKFDQIAYDKDPLSAGLVSVSCGGIEVDQTFKPLSTNPQSGTAVDKAISIAVGDIGTALDELHTYSQTLISGGGSQ